MTTMGNDARSIAVFGGKKDAAQLRLDAEDIEEVAGDQFAPHAFGVVFLAYAEGHWPVTAMPSSSLRRSRKSM
jgi:hypothetical protein